MSHSKSEKSHFGGSAPLKERCYSMHRFEEYLKDFLKNAKFPLKQQDNSGCGISKENMDSFYLSNRDSALEGTISVDAYDSDFFSTKIITYAEKEDHFSGLISLSFRIKEDDSQNNPFDDSYDEKQPKEEESPFMFRHKPKKCEYTNQKEWITGMEGKMRRYSIANKGDIIVLRNKVVTQFAKEYLLTLKNFMKKR